MDSRRLKAFSVVFIDSVWTGKTIRKRSCGRNTFIAKWKRKLLKTHSYGRGLWNVGHVLKSEIYGITELFFRFSDKRSYSLQLKALDGGGKTATARLNINVVDMKAPPKFAKDTYEQIVEEGTAVGNKVIEVQADYKGSSALLKYSFVRGNIGGTFCISGGDISVAQPLDFEKVPLYELVVMVSLGDTNDTAVVKVNVQDNNNDSPKFDKSVITVQVEENKGQCQVGRFIY